MRGVRRLRIENAHTGERFSGAYFADGLYLEEESLALDRVLRDHVADEATMMDVRLYDLLSELQRDLGVAAPVTVTSGYRTHATNERLRRRNRWAAKGSLHVPGMAADIKVKGVSGARLVRIAKALGRGGVGSYGGASFIHVDVGDVRSWAR